MRQSLTFFSYAKEKKAMYNNIVSKMGDKSTWEVIFLNLPGDLLNWEYEYDLYLGKKTGSV